MIVIYVCAMYFLIGLLGGMLISIIDPREDNEDRELRLVVMFCCVPAWPLYILLILGVVLWLLLKQYDSLVKTVKGK